MSPRSLHSLNVFLIKLTSFPILVVIGLYERYFATGQAIRETGKGAAHTLFNSLPRSFKNMPLVEALVGSSSADLYEAIFDVEAEHHNDLFDDQSEYDFPTLRSFPSRDNIRRNGGRSPTPAVRRRPSSMAPPQSPHRDSPRASPRLRPLTTLTVDPGAGSAEVASTVGGRSPLARLFTRSAGAEPQVNASTISNMEASVKKIEALVDDIREMPVQRLKEEMKELQVRLITLQEGLY